MTTLKTRALTLAAVTVAVTAFSAPSFAQTQRYAPDNSVISSAGSVVPGYVQSTPEKHWSEDGYGRWSPSDSASGN
jgi:hypothetical protein